jgi:hypothetical protein
MPTKPGNYAMPLMSDYSAFTGSMADEMDRALLRLMLTDGLGDLGMDPGLELRVDSFRITLPEPIDVMVTPDITVDMS